MTKQILLNVIMMVETVVDLLFPVSIHFLSKNLLNQSNDTILYNPNIILKKVTLTAAQRPYYPFHFINSVVAIKVNSNFLLDS